MGRFLKPERLNLESDADIFGSEVSSGRPDQNGLPMGLFCHFVGI